MFGRNKPSRTHTQQLWDELIESYLHLKLAAAHAAGGAAERITPSYDRARDSASRRWHTTRDSFSPLYEQMREGAATARKKNQMAKRRKKWPVLFGLLAAGTAAGAAGAIVARRKRTAAEWSEYEPLPALGERGYATSESSPGKRMTAGAASVADSVSNQAAKVAETLHEKSGRGGAKSGGASDILHP